MDRLKNPGRKEVKELLDDDAPLFSEESTQKLKQEQRARVSDQVREDASARFQRRVAGDRYFQVISMIFLKTTGRQGTQLGMSNGMPFSLCAIAHLLRARRIQFLGLTGTGLDDFDGGMLAAALAAAPPRTVGEFSSHPDTLDLTQIQFSPAIRTRLPAAGEQAGVRASDGPALRLP